MAFGQGLLAGLLYTYNLELFDLVVGMMRLEYSHSDIFFIFKFCFTAQFLVPSFKRVSFIVGALWCCGRRHEGFLDLGAFELIEYDSSLQVKSNCGRC